MRLNRTPNDLANQILAGFYVNLFCLIYLIIWALLPVTRGYLGSGAFRVLFGVVTILWIITAIQNYSFSELKFPLLFISAFFLIICMFLSLNRTDSSTYVLIRYVLLIGFVLNGRLYEKINNKKVDNIICLLSIVLIICTSITTITALLSNPNASRLLASSSTDELTVLTLQRQNVGSYDFIYGLTILLPSILFATRVKSNPLIHVIFLLTVVLSIISILLSNFTTSLLMMFAAFVLIAISGRGRDKKRISVILFMILFFSWKKILNWLLVFVYGLTPSIYARTKIDSILGLIEGNSSLDSTSSRVELLEKSVNTFLSNPVFGVGAYYSTAIDNGVGQHSQFIDDFARFGIFGGLALIFLMVWGIKLCFLNDPNQGRNILDKKFFASTGIFFALGFLNPVYNYAIMAIFFIIAPTLLRKQRELESR